MLALIQGEAKLTGATVVELTPAGPERTALAAEPEGAEAEAPELLADLMPADKQKPEEWSGYTGAVKAGEPVFFTIRGEKEWEKAWKTVSNEEAPETDFGKKMIIGIIAGNSGKADTVRILTRRRKTDLVIFDYYITETTEATRFVPYIFKAVDRFDGKVEFNRLDVGGKR
jgi:hypothetical protein